jgi:hypothetical protein
MLLKTVQENTIQNNLNIQYKVNILTVLNILKYCSSLETCTTFIILKFYGIYF